MHNTPVGESTQLQLSTAKGRLPLPHLNTWRSDAMQCYTPHISAFHEQPTPSGFTSQEGSPSRRLARHLVLLNKPLICLMDVSRLQRSGFAPLFCHRHGCREAG